MTQTIYTIINIPVYIEKRLEGNMLNTSCGFSLSSVTTDDDLGFPCFFQIFKMSINYFHKKLTLQTIYNN